MLRTLEIRDMLIIDRLEIAFQPGLNVLTGETGAGKSILLDSLGFVLGWRGRADLVRQGAEQGEVTAVFDLSPDHPAQAVLAEAGMPGAEELILRRVNTLDGRKTAYVNDRRASGEVLRALSDVLVELHGQQDDRGLLNPRGHRDMLDAFGALEAPREAVRVAWRALLAARKAVGETEAALEKVRAEEDFLRHSVKELDRLAPEPGEEATLDTRRRAMQGAERIRGDIARAFELMGEGALGEALRWLDGVADKAEGALDEPIAALNRAMIELSEAQSGVERALEGMRFDTFDLEAAEERLFAIRGLARKHGVAPDDLALHADTLRGRLAALDAGDADLGKQRAAVKAAETAYDAAAGRIELTGVGVDAALYAELKDWLKRR